MVSSVLSWYKGFATICLYILSLQVADLSFQASQMRASRIFFYFFLSAGLLTFLVMHCATQRDLHPIVDRTELPDFKGETGSGELNLEVLFYINADGTVENVRMMNTSGDSRWDSMAVDSMKKWRVEAPPANSNGITVRKNIKVDLLPSEIINLGILVARSENGAEILHNRLRAGISFNRMVRQASESSSLIREGYYLEDVDTADFPVNISRILLDLDTGEFSRPVVWEGKFVIFRRYGNRVP